MAEIACGLYSDFDFQSEEYKKTFRRIYIQLLTHLRNLDLSLERLEILADLLYQICDWKAVCDHVHRLRRETFGTDCGGPVWDVKTDCEILEAGLAIFRDDVNQEKIAEGLKSCPDYAFYNAINIQHKVRDADEFELYLDGLKSGEATRFIVSELCSTFYGESRMEEAVKWCVDYFEIDEIGCLKFRGNYTYEILGVIVEKLENFPGIGDHVIRAALSRFRTMPGAVKTLKKARGSAN